MEYTMPRALSPNPISGISVSGLDVSTAPHGWQPKRRSVLAVDAFAAVDGTGVSAGGCRT